jgi:hypothetical protein
MIFPRDGYELITDENEPPAGSYVALGCPHPDCEWVSSSSKVLDVDRSNEVALALRAREDEFHRHWIDNHQPPPVQLIVIDSEDDQP